jgi:hypothetical protein
MSSRCCATYKRSASSSRINSQTRPLLKSKQIREQDRFVTAGAGTRQPEGMAKQPAVCTTALAEPTFAA